MEEVDSPVVPVLRPFLASETQASLAFLYSYIASWSCLKLGSPLNVSPPPVLSAVWPFVADREGRVGGGDVRVSFFC